MPNPDLHHLPRLDRSRYQAFAAVHWTMPVLPRVPGWLDDRLHQQFRELQLHACARERLFCPAYCLMPDHLHFVWIGLSVQSNQRNAVKFFREHLNRMLAGENLSEPGSPANSRSQLPRKWKLPSIAGSRSSADRRRAGTRRLRQSLFLRSGQSGPGGTGATRARLALQRRDIARLSDSASISGRLLATLLASLLSAPRINAVAANVSSWPIFRFPSFRPVATNVSSRQILPLPFPVATNVSSWPIFPSPFPVSTPILPYSTTPFPIMVPSSGLPRKLSGLAL